MIDWTQDAYFNWFSQQAGARIFIVGYPGNQGDKLITLGTQKLLQKVGCQEVDSPEKADIHVYPGGNISVWRSDVKALTHTVEAAGPNVQYAIGPSGFPASFYSLSQPLNNPVVKAAFARDHVSLRQLKRYTSRSDIQIGLAHDPAFYLSDDIWLDELRRNSTKTHILGAFRQDREGDLYCHQLTSKILPVIPYRASRWLSQKLTRKGNVEKFRQLTANRSQPVVYRDASNASYQDFLSLIQNAAEIHTNRLHVFILGAMLGKPIFVYDTPAHKLENIYRASMEPWLQNCEFV
ncbi:polysaccharide pyruvyl transferase family protein [Cerasicoccus frondis]|uniref:polysaccharide pyruvyl transferase family protein n=1 Tax=Cerasicoccus frondis TaxID=490090 RepID=UPI00285263EE|nr:polysaccharide pyruvyl transferase family protein [Cerasicoccus frondis]